MDSKKVNKNNIVCRWAEENKFLVNPDGQVFPCCYLGNQGYKFRVTGLYNKKEIFNNNDDISNPVMQKYYEHEKELNVNNE